MILPFHLEKKSVYQPPNYSRWLETELEISYYEDSSKKSSQEKSDLNWLNTYNCI